MKILLNNQDTPSTSSPEPISSNGSSSPVFLEKHSSHIMMMQERCRFYSPAPFSDDPIAVARREAVDYSIKITLEEAFSGRARRQVRVYADGVYDMFHSGHARQLLQAKTAFPPETDVYLIVGMNSDEETHAHKGKTVMSEDERYEVIRHCRYVDEVYRGGPFYPDEAFIKENKIDFIAHDDLPYPYADGSGDAYEWVKKAGQFLTTQRTPSISTTQVITRIISDYDAYLLRNLKRGCSTSELGVSYVKGQRLKIAESTEMAKVKANSILEHWEDRSREFIGNFIGMFERGARIGSWLLNNNGHHNRRLSPPESCNNSVNGADAVSITSCDDTDSFADDFDVAEMLCLEVQPC